MTVMAVAESAQVFAGPEAYANDDYFHLACDLLRVDQPVVVVETEWAYPFWAVTKHADVPEVEARPGIFTNDPRPVLVARQDDDAVTANGTLLRTLIHMEDPDHCNAVLMDFFASFTELTQSRRAHPTDDLASVVANAHINGELIPDLEAMSYYTIIASIAGGMLGLMKNPDQLARLQNHPELMASTVDETIRHTSPVKHFIRTAQEDYTLRGTKISKGDSVLLSCSSANRNEDVFIDPHQFDVGRTPNKQLAFGFGVHCCVGAILARIKLKAPFSAIIARLDSISLSSIPALTQSTFVSGLKHLPITYTLCL